MRQLPAWYVNAGKRLVKSPKVYLRDSGLLHTLNRINTGNELPLHLIVGSSWEGYVIEQIHQLRPRDLDLYYYRTHHGAECNLLLVDGLKPVMAIGIKYSSTPSLSKGFYTVMDDLKIKQGHIITPKEGSYRVDKQVRSGSLLQFLQVVLPKL